MMYWIDSDYDNIPFFKTNIGCRVNMDFTKYGPKRKGLNHIVYVAKGKGYFNGNPVKAGQGFLLYSGPVVEYFPDESDPMEYLWFTSGSTEFRKVMNSYTVNPSTLIFDYDFVDKIENIMNTVIENHSKSYPPSQILETFLHIYNSHNFNSDRIRKNIAKHYVDTCIEYIEKNIHMPITTEMLTELIHVSQPYLHKIFIHHIGMSPKQYIIHHKFKHAKTLLVRTDAPITEIAKSIGYDVLSFSRLFSKKEHISPTKYRKREKEQLNKIIQN